MKALSSGTPFDNYTENADRQKFSLTAIRLYSFAVQGGPKKRGHSVLQKYCSDLHDFFAEIKVI